ncbi:hypothetical protein MSHOH_1707 [Methanosarcina horonobensis HB-1 = JCM 15518]|uniref:NurA domain-containing protein n=1 Tax=Methanosarcina horonobensis HB-1 = JCM 15518 TaxID=1434110 RepID=A0A0E3WUJ4_9EURY|nr:hypothetical protein [Methanosarcina horonobensis]AKB78190.1 hypothetical protein MSHOH_1707 [Methanosarcina horonobensis HB-1 = JCM 15518]
MLDVNTLPPLKKAINDRAKADRFLLDNLRKEVRYFAPDKHRIQPYSTTAVSLVASDGGNNKLAFDPFYVQLIRVTDSYGKELCLDAVSPSTDTDELSDCQFNPDGTPRTALGKMMRGLRVTKLHRLSPMIPKGAKIRSDPHSVKPGWVMVYRDLCEWAVLYERLCHTTFATDTLIVRDGLLRSKIFSKDLFIKWRKNVEEAIIRIQQEDKRRVFLVGLAKHSKVIDRYQLAMAIEDIFPSGDAWYVRIPRDLEAKAYIWQEYARGAEVEGEETEAPKFVAGDMYLVRFGKMSGDPIWAVDIFSHQSPHSSEIFGYLLNDAINGFPVPFYPLCLQKAHEYAQVVDFDLEIFQDEIYSAVRDLLPPEKQPIIDSWRFKSDVSMRRYG